MSVELYFVSFYSKFLLVLQKIGLVIGQGSIWNYFLDKGKFGTLWNGQGHFGNNDNIFHNLTIGQDSTCSCIDGCFYSQP